MIATRLVFAAALAATVSACTSMPTAMGNADPATKAALDRLMPNRCNATVAAALAGAGITAADIRTYGIESVPRNNGTTIYGTDGWIGLNGKPGNVVVSMDDACKLRTVYGRS